MPRRDEDFPETVRRSVAGRVGYLCSNPKCRAQTTGPHTDAHKANSVGEAAHINGAKPGAARYNPQLTLDELKSADNAIWLCGICAGKVDKDEVAYPVELLRQWKRDAELEASKLLGRTRLKENDRAGVPQPELSVSFADGESSARLAASWVDEPLKEHKKIERIPPRNGGRGITVLYPHQLWYTPAKIPGTTELAFRVQNETVIEARNVEVTISLPDGCKVLPEGPFKGATKGKVACERKDRQIVFRCDSLLHWPVCETEQVKVVFPTPDTAYELQWAARAGNMFGERSGVLAVHILAREDLGVA